MVGGLGGGEALSEVRERDRVGKEVRIHCSTDNNNTITIIIITSVIIITVTIIVINAAITSIAVVIIIAVYHYYYYKYHHHHYHHHLFVSPLTFAGIMDVNELISRPSNVSNTNGIHPAVPNSEYTIKKVYL